MIELRNISKHYHIGHIQVDALRQLSLSIKAGDFVALVGPSGCGKSTTLSIVGLLDRPSSGCYRLKGQDTSAFDANELAKLRNRTMGFIFQSFHLLSRFNALQNVGLPLIYRGLPENIIKERALESMKQVGIAHLAKHKPDEMSGGQQQRVAVARALVGNPSIILADEPTGALDSKTSRELMDLLTELNKHHQVTILLVTHDEATASRCSRKLVMQDGVIVDA